MERLGTQSIAYGFGHIPEVVGHHREELGIDLEPERRVGSQLVGVGPIDRLVDNQEPEHHHQGVDLQQGQQQHGHAPLLPCVGSLRPSYEPSTPFGSL